MKQSSEKTIRPTISDILLDVEDIGCIHKTAFNKAERNDVGYSKINNITVRIKSTEIIDRVINDNKNRIIFDTIDRLSSYLDYEGFKMLYECSNIHFFEISYNINQ